MPNLKGGKKMPPSPFGQGDKKEPGAGTLPSGAHALAAIGPKTEEVVQAYFSSSRQSSLFQAIPHQDLKNLANAFTSVWNDEKAAVVVREYLNSIISGKRIDITSLSRWVLSHPNEPDAIHECMRIDPPPEITIIRVLSRAGSQKLVFLATWQLTQREVVVKSLTGPPDAVATIIGRESRSHPLSMTHDHIIETHAMRNHQGEVFLVEEKLPEILHDGWLAPGIEELANLLYHITDALNHLHTNLKLVHGDVKPDNIGKRGEKYILLDFGICRPASEFTRETTPTGSLRTRAPELFDRGQYVLPEKVDVWALGATVYNAAVGRYPLFRKGEKPPRVSSPEEREKFETELHQRVKTEWEQLVTLEPVPEVLRELLSSALERDPTKRCSSQALLDKARHQLPVYLRLSREIRRFSPMEELNQLEAYLPSGRVLEIMPQTERAALLTELKTLNNTPGFNKEELQRINKLLINLS